MAERRGKAGNNFFIRRRPPIKKPLAEAQGHKSADRMCWRPALSKRLSGERVRIVSWRRACRIRRVQVHLLISGLLWLVGLLGQGRSICLLRIVVLCITLSLPYLLKKSRSLKHFSSE